jgi:tRNA-(ms[2]io[6]A)-hydroxylase
MAPLSKTVKPLSAVAPGVTATGWLGSRTDPSWASRALADIPAFLSDHAHLERKAAANAMGLLARCPAGGNAARWTGFLSTVAREEARHLDQVIRILHKRGGTLSVHHTNPYAAELFGLVRMAEGPRALLDRLLVSALVEARSCERFQVLAEHSIDDELKEFFAGLLRSEDGHAKGFLRLAAMVLPRKELDARWGELREAEARILSHQPHGPRMHAG